MLVDLASRRLGQEMHCSMRLEGWASLAETGGPENFPTRLENDRSLTCYGSLDVRQVHARQETMSENFEDEVV